MNCRMPGLPVLHCLPEAAQTHVHWFNDAIQPSHSLLPPSPPALNLSKHQSLFQWVSSSHQVTKVLELQLQYQSFQWIFRVDSLEDSLRTGLISLLSKGLSRVSLSTTVSAFFMVQLSHPYMTTGKTIALTQWTFINKVMSLFFNMLSRLAIAFLPRSKCLLTYWLQLPSSVILEPKKRKSLTVSIVSHLFVMKWWDQMPWS